VKSKGKEREADVEKEEAKEEKEEESGCGGEIPKESAIPLGEVVLSNVNLGDKSICPQTPSLMFRLVSFFSLG